MSWHYLPELAGVSSRHSICSDGAASVRWRLSRIGGKCCCGASGTACWTCSRSGMMCEHSPSETTKLNRRSAPSVTAARWLLRLAFHANRSASQGNGTGNPRQIIYGLKQQELFRRSGLTMSCLRMCQEYAHTCQWSYETCEELATPSAGPSWLPPPLWVRDILDSASGYAPTFTRRDSRGLLGCRPLPGRSDTLGWVLAKRYLPTLTRCGNYNRRGASETSGDGLITVLGGRVNPEWAEWYMGWPMGWTDLRPLAMDRFQRWLRSHGGCCKDE